MATFDKIKPTEYNVIQNTIANVLGATGSGQYGYGQTVQSSQVDITKKVSVEQFANLRYDLLNAYDHLYATTPSGVIAKTARDKIKYSTTTEPIVYWQTVANDIVSVARQAAIATRRRTVNHGTTNSTWPGPYGATWNTRLVALVQVSFTDAAQARYFFNSGSSFDFTSTRSGGSSTAQNTSWTNLLNAAGTPQFGGNFPGGGTSPQNGFNAYRLTNAYNSPAFSFTASSPYALNTWKIYARCVDVTNNSSGTARQFEFRVEWNDDHVGLGFPTVGPDQVDGTMSLNVTTTEATGTLFPAGLGNFTIETPSVFVGGIAPA